MTRMSTQIPFFAGWDVGGWNCDNNANSRDAIVILDAALQLIGQPWRGNLREAINAAKTAADWIEALFQRCRAPVPDGSISAVMAVDTPLGFSDEFRRLAGRLKAVPLLEESAANPYLFRQTERWLFERGLRPLSAVKDMIGSQATKGMHVLAKFAPRRVGCGVWTDGSTLTAIEAYPAACKASQTIKELRARFPPLGHGDCEDALTCALIAHLFQTSREHLCEPEKSISGREGWIWIPRDAN